MLKNSIEIKEKNNDFADSGICKITFVSFVYVIYFRELPVEI